MFLHALSVSFLATFIFSVTTDWFAFPLPLVKWGIGAFSFVGLMWCNRKLGYTLSGGPVTLSGAPVDSKRNHFFLLFFPLAFFLGLIVLLAVGESFWHPVLDLFILVAAIYALFNFLPPLRSIKKKWDANEEQRVAKIKEELVAKEQESRIRESDPDRWAIRSLWLLAFLIISFTIGVGVATVKTLLLFYVFSSLAWWCKPLIYFISVFIGAFSYYFLQHIRKKRRANNLSMRPFLSIVVVLFSLSLSLIVYVIVQLPDWRMGEEVVSFEGRPFREIEQQDFAVEEDAVK